MNHDDEGEGQRIVRGRPRKWSTNPRNILEAAPGAIVLIAVRVAAHFAGCGGGPYTDVLCRPYDLDSREELHRCRDLYISRAELVAIYDVERLNR